ncbi:FliH/SctL family protein [Liquorilactobacillus mali]|uniref:Flagellar assembly protein FliH n=1 Tax=Liquorilactobacillus mali KCTC 3596 = DSM 20444 TaxID=1046596 RepID=J0L1Y4_9LACO|nr:FliH/SctL family protein [Liquorilactobacillus mali]AJA34112.1 flagellar assembly protein FliH [Liquorilactobacillus mali KCTC 3596 = DSM 20444]EJF02197.1 flagellar assembly protein FliH [Liquorilactobacillus mali KCTC 3596 = DSM 20444]KRN11135.1 flagellar assembly protein FliH [Liquorilactobacillus mali KCTC 3596 = DSM 20444]MDC7953974.1 flagellar assembly protein FliH [Liquorilactobacillus mali]MDV7757457.1 flagellar assembly protein FliH [Liquorilactobacillus mali]
MQLSNKNLVKSNVISSIEEKRKIVTKMPESRGMPKSRNNLGQMGKQQRESLEVLKETIIESAKVEANKIRDKAYKDGEREGFEKGYQDGKNEGQKVATELIEKARKNYKDIAADIKCYEHDKRDEIFEFAVEMAEMILRHRIDEDAGELLILVEPIFFKLEKPDQTFIIHANERYHDLIVKKMEEKRSEVSRLRYTIINDSKMGLYEINIESSDSLETFNLKNELKKYVNSVEESVNEL